MDIGRLRDVHVMSNSDHLLAHHVMHDQLGVLLWDLGVDIFNPSIDFGLFNEHLAVRPGLLVLCVWHVDGAPDRSEAMLTVRAHIQELVAPLQEKHLHGKVMIDE